MPENLDRRAYNEGRPKIPELEKMRRKARRDDERYKEVKAELRHLGPEDPKPRAGPGRPPKTRQEIAWDRLRKLRAFLAQIRMRERELGEPHKTLREIRDPLIDNKTLTKVGRKPADDLTENDFLLVKALDALEDVVLEIEDEGIHPLPKKRGRKPKNRLDKLEDRYQRLRDHIRLMVDLENDLTPEEKMERQIKLYYDELRVYRKLIKINQADQSTYRLIDRRTEDIDRLKEQIREVEYQRDQLGLNVGYRDIKLDRYFDSRLRRAHNNVGIIRQKYGLLNF